MTANSEDRQALFDSPSAALPHMLEYTQAATRSIDIFTQQLPSALYDDPDLVQAISNLIRYSSRSKLRILIRNPRPLYGNYRPLLQLANRLPSHASIHVCEDDTGDHYQGFYCCDKSQLVRFTSEADVNGFARTNARAEARSILDEFDTLWIHGSNTDPNLRNLML